MLLGGKLPLEAGEQRVLAVRSHSWPLVRAALPLLGLVLSLGPYAALDVAAPELRLAASFPLFLGAVAVAASCYLLKWLALDLLPWTQRVYVLTNRRLIAQAGVLAMSRREYSLLTIQESDYVVRGPIARLFDVGDVEVQSAGEPGTVVLRAVAQPRRVQALISAQARMLHDEVAHHHLLEAPDEVVRQLEAIVRNTPPSHSAPTAQLRPVPARVARTQARLNLLPGEVVIDVMRRHPIVLARGLLVPLIAALVVIAGAMVVGPAFIPLAAALVLLVPAPWAIWHLLTYLQHQYVLTTERLMELRSTPFVFHMRDIVQISSVQDVALDIPSLFGRLADVGDVTVEVAGTAHRLVLQTVARPAQRQSKIFEAIDAQQRRAREAEDQRLMATLSRWFQEYHRLQQGGGGPI